MLNLGTVRPGSTIYIPFDSFAGSTGASITLTGLAATDIEIYKDGSVTQRASDNGYTLLDTDGIDFDGITGIHGFSISLADNSTAGFYAAGSRYFVVISSVTIDSQTVSFLAACFDIGYPDAVINTTIATLSSQTSFTLTAGPAEDDALNGCVVCIHDVASAVQLGFATVSDYTGSTKTVTLVAGTTFTAAATDNISIFARHDLSWIQGVAVSTSTAQLGVNTVQAGGTAWGSGAITANSIASDAITAAKIATGAIDADAIADNAIDAGALAADCITAAKIAAGAIDAATFAADVDAEILSYIVDDATRIDASALNTASVTTVPAILVDTAEIGAAGAGLSAIPWNASWDAEVQSEVDDALVARNLSTIEQRLRGLVLAQGTIGSTGNDTTHVHLTGLTYGNDEINNWLLVIFDVSESEYHARWVEDWVDASDLATVATLPFTPQNATDTYWLLPIRQDVTGGSGLDAAGVRAAIGMASANLDTQLGAIDDYIDSEVSAIKTKTDQLTFSTSNRVDAQVFGMEANTVTASAIATDAIGAAELADGAITAATFAASAIDATAIAANAITAAKIADGAIDAATFAAGAIDATAIAADAITAAKIADGAIDAATFASGAINAAAIAADAITAAKIADGAIDANTFASGAITASAIATDAIGSDELAASAITEIQSGLSTLTAAGIRTAVGLASANLDTQLDALPTTAEVNAEVDTALADVGLTTTITGRIDAAVSTRATPAQILTTALTEAYAADGAAPTLSQLLFLLLAALTEFSIASTTITVKKLDGTTTAATYTLNDATNPTSRTRAT